MDPRRPSQHDYGRNRGGDGGGYGTVPSSSGRPVPPTGVPSLSTGQGFYTVESLQGATMVPPPQPAPPPPRFLPHHRDPHLHPAAAARRADFPPFDRRYPPPPAAARKMMMMMMGPPDMPMPRPGMLPHHPLRPPPFMGGPRMPGGFHHLGHFNSQNGWGPAGFGRRAFDHRGRGDHMWASQRIKAKKQGQRPGNSQSKDKKSLADKQNPDEGGPGWCALCKVHCSNAESLKMHISGRRHKKQVESQGQADELTEKTEEAKEEGGDTATAFEHSEHDEDDETMVTEGLEDADDVAMETTIIDLPEGEGNSQPSDAKSVAGRKRALKDAANPNKRPCKTVALSDAIDGLPATNAKTSEDVTNENKIQKTSDPEVAEEVVVAAHNASQTSSVSLKLEGDGDEQPTSEKNLFSESVQECVDGAKEVRNVTNLANGSAGQSAEIQ